VALATFETERPHLWRELKSRSAENLIDFAEREKSVSGRMTVE